VVDRNNNLIVMMKEIMIVISLQEEAVTGKAIDKIIIKAKIKTLKDKIKEMKENKLIKGVDLIKEGGEEIEIKDNFNRECRMIRTKIDIKEMIEIRDIKEAVEIKEIKETMFQTNIKNNDLHLMQMKSRDKEHRIEIIEIIEII